MTDRDRLDLLRPVGAWGRFAIPLRKGLPAREALVSVLCPALFGIIALAHGQPRDGRRLFGEDGAPE